jgi:hypothetical protein
MKSLIHSLIAVLITILLKTTIAYTQKAWDGEGGDGQWNTATNWVGNIVPSTTDDVLLDNSFVSTGYIVQLPAGNTAVTIRSVTISPSSSNIIELTLPTTNTAIPGFSCIGAMYGLVIHSGGIFKNSSGASTGTPVNISDSIRINNGGLYIHNTSRAHAANVTVLSREAGTEMGTFEFDVPGGSGYTVSITGRVYGKLVLSANAAGGTKSYTSTGSTTVNINGEFRLNPGVNYSLNFSGGFIIHREFYHHGNLFDVSGGLHSNLISIRKNIDQSGIITESGTGSPVIEFSGSVNQSISITGSITGNIALRINNSSGITLQTPLLVSNKIELINGRVKTSSSNMLVVQDNAICSGGSSNSFIDGPMRKIGDDDFDFPIGKGADYAPISISGTGGGMTDEFKAEYFLGNPVVLFGGSIEDPPIIRVSKLEYWQLDQTVGASSKNITLSVRTYSHATLLEKLVVSRWDDLADIWKSEGNFSFSGIATGTVTSNAVHLFGTITLSSTVVDQNPLPSVVTVLNAKTESEHAILSWQINPQMQPVSFEVLKSADSRNFVAITKISYLDSRLKYQFRERLLTTGIYYYRLKVIDKNGVVSLSNLVPVFYEKKKMSLVSCLPSVTRSTTTLFIYASENLCLQLNILNVEARIVQKIPITVSRGTSSFKLDLSHLAAGVYYISGMTNNRKSNIIQLIKY